jgi:hypothetical protein
MANPVKGESHLKLKDGRSFVLIADHAGLIRAAQAHSGSTKINRLMRDIQPQLDKHGKVEVDEFGDPVKDTLPATAAFLYGMLDAHHEEVSLREATNILLSDIETVSAAIQAAVETGFPDVAEGKQGSNPPGKSTGGRGAKPV